MADENYSRGPLKKGSHMDVTVEEAIADVLLVCLKYGAKLYRGVLLDSTKSGLPCIRDFTKVSPLTALNSEGSVQAGDGAMPEMSALSKRHTYMEKSKCCTSGNLCTIPKDVPQPSKQKAKIRNMRLRPRQVLCTNCKRGIHNTVMDVAGKGTSTELPPITDNTTNGIVSVNDAGQCSSVNDVDVAVMTESETKRCRLDEDITDSATVDDVAILSKIKSNPVIKISYATPRGEGTIVNTLSMPDGVSLCESVSSGTPTIMPSPLSSVEGGQTPITCARVQKPVSKVILKKAKLRVKCRTPPHDCVAAAHKRSRRSKHKAKRKHRRKEASEVSTADEQYKENVASVAVDESSDSLASNSDQSATYLGSECRSDGEEKTSDTGYQRYSIMSNTDTSSLKRTIYRINSPLSIDTGAASPLRPLTMRIHTRAVSTCVSANGQSLATGDVVWGKIHGFPWWPGCVGGMTESRTDSGAVVARLAHISWYGSSTVSHMPCSQLCPFLTYFDTRYNRKKRGAYKRAIKQATIAARSQCLDVGLDCDTQLAEYDIE